MALKIHETSLPGLLVFEPDWFPDERGFFMETYNAVRYAEAGFSQTFVQDNHSYSHQNVLRGMHYQRNFPQGKLVHAIHGEIFDVAVDIRRGSPTFGQYYGIILNEENKKQIYIPPGYAHGFCVLSDSADVCYKCSAVYRPGDEIGILFSDPQIGIDWPVDEPVVSEKDRKLPHLAQIPEDHLPLYPAKME